MFKKLYLLLLALAVIIMNGYGQQILTLQEVVDMAQKQSIQAKLAETTRKNLYYQYLTFKSDLRPQLSLSGYFPQYSKDYFAVVQPDGSQKYLPRHQNTTDLGLSLYQEIPFSGGRISIFSNLNRFDDFDRKYHQYSTAPVSIRVDQPLFSFNELKWEKKIAPLRYKESQKQYTQDMANIAIQAEDLYFNVLDAQVHKRTALANLENNRAIYAIEQKRVDLGTTSEEKLLQIKLQLLKSEQDIMRAQFDQQKATQNLKTFLGISGRTNLKLQLPQTVPDFDIDTAKALKMAQSNRPEFVGFTRRMLEVQRDLLKAKRSRFQVDITAIYGLNNADTQLPKSYRDLKDQQQISIGFQIPIMDWGRQKYRVETAIANKKITEYTIEKERITFQQEIKTAISNFTLLKESMHIARETDSIAQRRYDLALRQYQAGKLNVTDLNIALEEKDNAQQSYLLMLRTFWNSYYTMRSLTLCNFKEDNEKQ